MSEKGFSTNNFPLIDEVDLEYDLPDEDGCIHVEVSGSWYVDKDRLTQFANHLAELINAYKI